MIEILNSIDDESKFDDDEFGHYSTYSHPYEGLTIRPVTDKSN